MYYAKYFIGYLKLKNIKNGEDQTLYFNAEKISPGWRFDVFYWAKLLWEHLNKFLII